MLKIITKLTHVDLNKGSFDVLGWLNLLEDYADDLTMHKLIRQSHTMKIIK